MDKKTVKDESLPRILARLRAELKGVSADPTDYKKYLERKYKPSA